MLIPKAAVPRWYELGVKLGLATGILDTINANATRRPVEECSKEMLRRWLTETPASDATPDRLITALKRLDENRLAQRFSKGC